MFDIMKTNEWDDMFKTMDALMQYPFKERTLETQGLKSLIRRPHNIINIKDSDGKIVAQRLEVVTTPFSTDDIKVTVNDNVLSVQCGFENKEEKDEEDFLYKGISSQSYSFALRLNNKIDKDSIKATNVDGVLKVELPFKEAESEIREIEINQPEDSGAGEEEVMEK